MALLLRLNKAAPLTNAELDNNLIYLDDRSTSLEASKLASADLLSHIKFVDGLGSGIDADKLTGMSAATQSLNSTVVARDASGNFSANVITATLVGSASHALTATSLDGIVEVLNGGTGVSNLNAGFISSNGTIFTSSSTIPASVIIGNIAGLSEGVTGIVPIENGGTGCNNVQSIKTALGLIVGQTIQSYSNNLQTLASISQIGILMYSGVSMQSRALSSGNCINITNADGVLGDPAIEVSMVDISHGGTGANSPASALIALGAAGIDSPSFSGIPSAETAVTGTNTSQLATTSFVINNSVPTGTILTTASQRIAPGYVAANGAQVLRASNQGLFAEIGIAFGGGNGTTTFNVPNVSAPTGFTAIIKT